MTAPFAGLIRAARFSILLILLASAGQPHLAANEAAGLLPTADKQSSADSTPANAGFEAGAVGEAPTGWVVPAVPEFHVVTSDEAPAEGLQCVSIHCNTDPGANPFGNLIQRVDAEPFRGQRVRLRAAVRAEVEGHRNQAQLWLRVDRVTPDGNRALGAFDNMGDRPIAAAKWNHYEIVADVAEDAQRITIGMMLLGKGKAWLDDVSLEIVGQDVPTTAKAPSGAGRSGKPLEEIKPGLFEIVGAMRIMPALGDSPKRRALVENHQGAHKQFVLIPLPLAYRDQVPLNYHFSVGPPAAVEAVEIYEDSPHNFVLKATLAADDNWKHIDVKFESTVLIGLSNFDEAPSKAPIPVAWPDEAEPWLKATWCADAEHERIRTLVAPIRAETSDVPEIIRRVQQTAGAIFRSAQGRVTSLTAVEALDKQGSCTSCANLVAALLRACGVPARVVAGYPSWSGPLQTHYIVEAYIPNYGWYPIESTMGQAPWPNTHQVHVAIVPPRYEEESKAGARLGIAGGVPYLSLTELPGDEYSLFSVGTIEGAAGCDHECRMIRALEGAPDEWNLAIAATTSRWQAWLDSTHELDDEGRLQFGKPSGDLPATSVTGLVGLLYE